LSGASLEAPFCLTLDMNIKLVFVFLFAFLSFNLIGQSLCWEITGNKLKQPSYLYGTMHVADKKVFNLSEASKKALESTAVFAMEIDPEKINFLSLLSDIMGDGKHSLKNELKPEDYNLLDSVLKAKTGFPLTLFDKLQPILIQTLITTSPDDIKDSSGLFLDMFLYSEAKNKGKKTTGVETIDEQLKALNALDYQDQITMLLKDLKEPSNADKEFENMVKHYIKGELDSLLLMSDEAKMPVQFNKILVIDRNIRMAERITKMIEKESHFIAIGALHLPGEQGVINLLRQKGLTVTPLK